MSNQIISLVQEKISKLVKSEVFYSLNFSDDRVFEAAMILQNLKINYNTSWFDEAYELIEQAYEDLPEDHPDELQLYLVKDRMMWLYIIAEDLDEEEAYEEFEEFNFDGINTEMCDYDINNAEEYIRAFEKLEKE